MDKVQRHNSFKTKTLITLRNINFGHHPEYVQSSIHLHNLLLFYCNIILPSMLVSVYLSNS
jgi:hypothetical protein